MNQAHFDITENAKGQFNLVLVAPNNEPIGSSQGEKYKNLQNALKGVASIRTHCTDISNFDVRASSIGEPYFVLQARNREIILVSEMYPTDQIMQKGVRSVMRNGTTDIVRTYFYNPELIIRFEGKNTPAEKVYLSEFATFFSDQTEGKWFPYGIAKTKNGIGLPVEKFTNLEQLKKRINELHSEYGKEIVFEVSTEMGYVRLNPQVLTDEQHQAHEES